MGKPIVSACHYVTYEVEDESWIHIMSKKDCYKTIMFPKGTKIQIFITKMPVGETKK